MDDTISRGFYESRKDCKIDIRVPGRDYYSSNRLIDIKNTQRRRKKEIFRIHTVSVTRGTVCEILEIHDSVTPTVEIVFFDNTDDCEVGTYPLGLFRHYFKKKLFKDVLIEDPRYPHTSISEGSFSDAGFGTPLPVSAEFLDSSNVGKKEDTTLGWLPIHNSQYPHADILFYLNEYDRS